MPNQSDLSSGASAKLDPTQTDPVQTPVVPPVDDNPVITVPDFQMADTSDISSMPTEDSQPVSNLQSPIASESGGTAAPLDDVSSMMVSPPPKKKFGGGKIIATILGLFLLIGGIAGGVILTQQKQSVSEKAYEETCSESGATDCATAERECTIEKADKCKWIPLSGDKCGRCVVNDGDGTPTASCQNIKAYSPTWTQLSVAQLSSLKANNQVNFCATGTTTPAQDRVQFTAARFTVNGTTRPETIGKRPGGGKNEFCDLYTIPAGTTTFNISAQVKILNQWK
ncbi:MAG: hypothetical protein AAB535_02345 [Patescibacteria group bacterium]